jgi:hypothetical protein
MYVCVSACSLGVEEEETRIARLKTSQIFCAKILYIYIYIYIYMYMYIYIYTHTHKKKHTHKETHTHTNLNVHVKHIQNFRIKIHTHIHTYMLACIHTYLDLPTRTKAANTWSHNRPKGRRGVSSTYKTLESRRIHTYIQTYIHKYAYIHISTYLRALMLQILGTTTGQTANAGCRSAI